MMLPSLPCKEACGVLVAVASHGKRADGGNAEDPWARNDGALSCRSTCPTTTEVAVAFDPSKRDGRHHHHLPLLNETLEVRYASLHGVSTLNPWTRAQYVVLRVSYSHVRRERACRGVPCKWPPWALAMNPRSSRHGTSLVHIQTVSARLRKRQPQHPYPWCNAHMAKDGPCRLPKAWALMYSHFCVCQSWSQRNLAVIVKVPVVVVVVVAQQRGKPEGAARKTSLPVLEEHTKEWPGCWKGDEV